MISYVLIGAITLLVLGAMMSQPLRMVQRQKHKNDPLAASQLEDQLHRFVYAVRDLDFDYDTGKIAKNDYIAQRKLLIGRGVSTLIKLDDLRQHDPLEKEIAAYRRQSVEEKE